MPTHHWLVLQPQQREIAVMVRGDSRSRGERGLRLLQPEDTILFRAVLMKADADVVGPELIQRHMDKYSCEDKMTPASRSLYKDSAN